MEIDSQASLNRGLPTSTSTFQMNRWTAQNFLSRSHSGFPRKLFVRLVTRGKEKYLRSLSHIWSAVAVDSSRSERLHFAILFWFVNACTAALKNVFCDCELSINSDLNITVNCLWCFKTFGLVFDTAECRGNNKTWKLSIHIDVVSELDVSSCCWVLLFLPFY